MPCPPRNGDSSGCPRHERNAVEPDAGLLDGRQATGNWAALDANEVQYPAVDWVRGVRYVETDDLISTAGITSGVNGTLRAVSREIGLEAAERLADEIGYPDRRVGDSPTIEIRRMELPDIAIAVTDAAFDWGRARIGVGLVDGVGELEVASVIDVHGGDAYVAETTTFAVGGGSLVTSAHGLAFVPRTTLDGGPHLDRIVVPGAAAATQRDPAFETAARRHGRQPVYLHASPDGRTRFPFDAALEDLAATTSVPAAALTAKALEYPTEHLRLDGPAWPVLTVIPVLAVAALGVALAIAVGRAVHAGLRALGRAWRGRRTRRASVGSAVAA